MRNPWETIALSDYENHMSLAGVGQLQVLNQMMKEQLTSCDADTVMILGIAAGNGLEHVRKESIRKVYGVDVNAAYLSECLRRYAVLGDTLETICADLLADDLQLPHAGLLIADLLVEYIGYERFQRVVKQVEPDVVSCIIQINTGDSFVSESPYLHAFDCLESVHHQMMEDALTANMNQAGYHLKLTAENDLPNGKKLVRMDYARRMTRTGALCEKSQAAWREDS